MNEVQNKLLETAQYFDKFCSDYNIFYYLMGGSALGAIRHQGFIPWDDDFDVFMTYENYKKFLIVAENYLDTSKYYFQKENTDEWPLFFSKIRVNGTTFIEEDAIGKRMHKGLYIDVMCLNKTSKYKFLRLFQYIVARIISTKTLTIKGYKTNKKIKRVVLFLIDKTVNRNVLKLLIKFVRFFNKFEKLSYTGHFFGRAKFKNTSFPEKWLGLPRYVKFENIKLPVMDKVEKYLTLRYGLDYMDNPSEEVRALYPNHGVIVDVNKNYTEYDS